MKYVLDTHVLIWYFTGSQRLRKNARDRIDECLSKGGSLLIPTIVLSECLEIFEKQRVNFDFPTLYKIIKDQPEFLIIDFTEEIFEETLKVKGIHDIHDRIITATARFYSTGVITKDKVIQSKGEVKI